MTLTRLPRATPSSRDVDAAGITRFLDAVQLAGLELHSFMVFKDDAVVAEAFWKPFGPDRPHMQHSATKSWTAVAVGFVHADGLLDLDDKVVDFFPEHLPAEISPNLAAMTVKDLLTMRTGHRTGLSGGEWRYLTGSWIEAFLNEPVVERPGTRFVYSSGSSYMLSAIVTKLTGQTVSDYLEPRLFRPLGMGEISWDVSPEGISTGGNGLSCSAEDMMKFSVLHLQDGMWNGQQVIPADWVRATRHNHVGEFEMMSFDGKRYRPADPAGVPDIRPGYGYQWWMTPHGGTRAAGVFGQYYILLPEQRAAITITAALPLSEKRLLSTVWAELFPALTQPGSAAADAALSSRLATLAMPVEAGALQSPRASEISGRTIRFAPNANHVSEASLSFAAGHCEFRLVDHRGTHRITLGLGHGIEGQTTMSGQDLHHAYQPDLMRVIASGVWRDEATFVMTWRYVETVFCDTVILRIEGDTVELDRSVNVNAGLTKHPTLNGALSRAAA